METSDARSGPASLTPVEEYSERCTFCGFSNKREFRFCRNCGRPSSRVPVPPAPADSAPSPSPVSPNLPPGLAAFLRFDANEHFNLLALNCVNYVQIVQEANRASRDHAHRVESHAAELLDRVRSDTEDTTETSRLLRTLAVRWYLADSSGGSETRDSPWTDWAREAYAGIFYESRAPGGRRKARLADRLLWASRGRIGPEEGRKLHLFGKAEDADDPATLEGKDPDEILLLRASQALLDDLASIARKNVSSVPLRALSEVAESASNLPQLNKQLQRLGLLPSAESFVLLDPDRDPGVGQVMIRWPNRRSNPHATQYTLSVAGFPEDVGPPDRPPAAPPPVVAQAPSRPETFDPSVWFDRACSPEEWVQSLTALQQARGRLRPPPGGDATQRLPGYTSLRAALLATPVLADLFHVVQWRGKPYGLPILTSLLMTQSYQCESDGDLDYLDPELDALAPTTPAGSTTGVWTVGTGRTVRREREAYGFRYTMTTGVEPPSEPR